MFSFIETKLFTRLIQQYLFEEEYAELQSFLIQNPEAGDTVPGSGGLRKLGWRGKGRGKRGGFRATESIPAYTLRQIRKEIENA